MKEINGIAINVYASFILSQLSNGRHNCGNYKVSLIKLIFQRSVNYINAKVLCCKKAFNWVWCGFK